MGNKDARLALAEQVIVDVAHQFLFCVRVQRRGLSNSLRSQL